MAQIPHLSSADPNASLVASSLRIDSSIESSSLSRLLRLYAGVGACPVNQPQKPLWYDTSGSSPSSGYVSITESQLVAIARKAGDPLLIEEVIVAPPKPHEFRIKIICTSLCDSDITFWKLEDPPSIFPRILSHEAVGLSGEFVPNENLGAKGWSGRMSVSLAGPDGRVLDGGLAGMLVAAGPV
ncbi:hypothetical protein L2E82_16067 [Cichorium intybus]|uniref:Uncharacterized protein n=1 Tax=Cichorium intybus TaxID=13427 RepID=A0ACB9F460_CICIN|nr:hypothetical protein L2E82_16067 [Cichorium intybus]